MPSELLRPEPEVVGLRMLPPHCLELPEAESDGLAGSPARPAEGGLLGESGCVMPEGDWTDLDRSVSAREEDAADDMEETEGRACGRSSSCAA